MQSNVKEITACITGHRPENTCVSYENIKKDLRVKIQQAILQGYRYFIVGCNRGTELWAGQIVLDLKKTYPNIKLVLVEPFDGYHTYYKIAENDYEIRDSEGNVITKDDYEAIYQQLKSNADYYKCLNIQNKNACLRIKNTWMLQNSSYLIISYASGSKGATRNMLSQALAKKMKIGVIDG